MAGKPDGSSYLWGIRRRYLVMRSQRVRPITTRQPTVPNGRYQSPSAATTMSAMPPPNDREVVGERAQQCDAVADEHHGHARRVRVDAESLEQPRPRAKFPAGRDIPGTRELSHAVEDHVACDDHNQDGDDDRSRHCPASLLSASLLDSQLSVQHYCRQPGPTGLSNMIRRLWPVS